MIANAHFERVFIIGGLKLRVTSAISDPIGPFKEVHFDYQEGSAAAPRFSDVTIVTRKSLAEEDELETFVPITVIDDPISEPGTTAAASP
jgi:hypothetical protein